MQLRNLAKRQSTPAMAIALVALFVALSGTAVALPGRGNVRADDLRRGAVGTRAIANNSVRSRDIRNGNVFSRDVNDGSLTGADIEDDSLTGNDVNESTLGKVPSAAAADTATRVGTNGVDTNAIQPYAVKGVRIAIPVRRTGAGVVISAGGGTATAQASCGGGERMIGGGPQYDGTFGPAAGGQGGIVDSYPENYYTWKARAYNTSGTTRSFRVWVMCIPNA